MRRYILSVVDFLEDPSGNRKCPDASASFCEWAFTKERPDFPNGGLHLPYTEGRLCQFEPTGSFSSRKAVAPGDAMDGCPSGPKRIITKLQASSGHMSAQQSRRVLVTRVDATCIC